MPTTSEKPRRGDAATFVFESLRRDILMLRIPPGAAIDEAALVREYEVSRTPVREALVRLASDGLVILHPNRGSQVAPLDLARVRDYLEAMDVIQPAVTALAAKRRQPHDLEKIRAACKRFDEACAARDAEACVLRNHEFHMAIAEASGNDLLTKAYKRLLDEGLRISPLSLGIQFSKDDKSELEFNGSISAQHWKIVEAIEARDLATCADIAEAHTQITRDWYSDYLSDRYQGRRSWME